MTRLQDVAVLAEGRGVFVERSAVCRGHVRVPRTRVCSYRSSSKLDTLRASVRTVDPNLKIRNLQVSSRMRRLGSPRVTR